MNHIEDYDREIIKRFITCNVPTSVCNLKCSYCYIRQLKRDDMKSETFVLSGQELGKLLSIKRLGGICYFNLCANGETLLHPELMDLIDALTSQGHYVDIITNGTIGKRINELVNHLNVSQQCHLFIKFSFHYLELIRTGLIDQFIDNVNKIKKSFISYTIEITPHDELIEYIDEIKRFSLLNFGALPHITVARNENTKNIELLTELDKDSYSKIWGQFKSKLFDFKFSIFNEKRKEFCYAGDWTLKLDLQTGEYKQCYKGCILGNICDNKPINFRAIGKCPLPHCFNGHAFLALGNIPELVTPMYSEERNRIMSNGEQWLKPYCNAFFSTKLYEANENYSYGKKVMCIAKNLETKIGEKIKRYLKNEEN